LIGAVLPGLTGGAAFLLLGTEMAKGNPWAHDELMLAMNLKRIFK